MFYFIVIYLFCYCFISQKTHYFFFSAVQTRVNFKKYSTNPIVKNFKLIKFAELEPDRR